MNIKAVHTLESVRFNGSEDTWFHAGKCKLSLESGFVYCVSPRACVAIPLVNVKYIELESDDPKVKTLLAAEDKVVPAQVKK